MTSVGSIVVLFSILLTLFMMLFTLVVNVGNWWVHDRHLQTMVDAAAFAGATEFGQCFDDPVAANTRSQALHSSTRATSIKTRRA